MGIGLLPFVVSLLLIQSAASPQSPPLTVTQQGTPVAAIHRSDLALPLPGVPMIDDDKLMLIMAGLQKKTDIPPVNAAIDGRGRIKPERAGARLDRRRFEELAYRYLVEGSPLQAEVPQMPVHAKVDSELLALIREKQIGYYTTYFNSYNKNRSRNIALAAHAIDNQVVFPGESFSFNRVVGMRSTDKGYMRAPIIVRGEVSEGIGGGICQISSTLFNAVDRAGLRIVQRYSHSRNVPYVPPGRDATVSWYGPDFVFQNRYSHPVLIRAFVSGGQVSVLIYSAEAIEYEPRTVPSASKRLPEEIRMEQNVGVYIGH